MKFTIAIAAAGLMSFGVVGITPAAAFHIVPENTAFTADGTTSATKNGITLPCIAHFQGTVDANGVGAVTSGSFTDNGAAGCTAVVLTNLPWPVVATGRRKVQLQNVSFSTPIGNCGPGDMNINLSNGHLKFAAVPLPPDCMVSGNITTSPALRAVRR